MGEVSAALFDSARSAVDLVIGLVGAMVFFLGLMRVAFEGGLRQAIARALAPALRRLFPEVPADHPAMSAMVMNLSSTMLGLGNAATPFGLKAMVELDRLNPYPGCASDAMVLLLAINTSLVALMPPLGTMAVRVAAGSTRPEVIWLPTFLATTCSTVAAVAAHFALRRRFPHRPVPHGRAEAPPLPAVELEDVAERRPASRVARLVIGATLVALAVGLLLEVGRLAGADPPREGAQHMVQDWLLPVLVAVLVLIGVRGGVPVYEAMIRGAREGLDVAVRIVPYLVAILVAVGMLRASGALDRAITLLAPAGAPARHPARGPADGAPPPAVGLRCLRGHERDPEGVRTGLLRRPRRQHASGLDRDDLLRPRDLLRCRRHPRRTPRARRRLTAPRRLRRRDHRVPLALRRCL
jgi:spore maturation protein SpmA